jgi:glucosamine 6-phosphate synthetase-like amidotransferase/phosphosugar isomerase protein
MRGYGICMWSDDSSIVIKDTGEIHPMVCEKAVAIGAHVLAAHTRAPTGEDIGVRGVHPFITDSFHFAHNGVLINWKREPFDHWRKVVADGRLWRTDVDSTAILAGIQYQTNRGELLPEAICETMREVEGQAGCWLYEEEYGALYLWRVMATLYLRQVDGVWYFSSAKTPLFRGTDLMIEGQVLRLPRGHTNPIARNVGSFDFKTPYAATEATVVRDI